MKGSVYLNGQYTPLEDAKVSVQDRGFVFGDGIYEVIPVICGVPIDLENHLEKMRTSLEKIEIYYPDTFFKSEIISIIYSLLEKNGIDRDWKIYIQITRGVAPRNHFFPQNIKPTLFVMLQDMRRPVYPCSGMNCILEEDSRWMYKDIKSVSLLANVLLRERARKKGVDEVILYRSNGVISEGALCNIFIVNKMGQVITHPADGNIIHGATRRRVIDLARKNNIEVLEAEFKIEDLLQAKEVFATTSGFFVNGICKVDETLINNGKVGQATHFLEKLFHNYVDDQIQVMEKSCFI